MDGDMGAGWHGGEVRLDYVLAEELEVDPALAAWFAAPTLSVVSVEAKRSHLSGLRVRLHVWDGGGDGCDSHDVSASGSPRRRNVVARRRRRQGAVAATSLSMDCSRRRFFWNWR
jgi:hypothetical protein